MHNRERQFLALYHQHRYDDQRRYYEGRSEEFEAGHRQAINLQTSLMVLAAVAATVAAIDLFSLRVVWSVLAAVLPLLATAVSAYEGLFAFERQAKLFGDAVNALKLAQARAPDAGDDATLFDTESVAAYVEQVEAVFRREQAQWGQLISEIKLSDTPSNET